MICSDNQSDAALLGLDKFEKIEYKDEASRRTFSIQYKNRKNFFEAGHVSYISGTF